MATPGWTADFAAYQSTAHYGSRASGTSATIPPARNLGRAGDCPPGTIQCVLAGGVWYCTDLNTDPFNCGGCCQPCDEGEVCCRGRCMPRHQCDIPLPPIPPAITGGCPAGLERCGTLSGCSFCTDTQFDRRHCGGCNQPCTGLNEVCCRGQCVVAISEENCGSDCSRCGERQRCCLAPTFDSAFRCVDLGTREHCLACNDRCLLSETCCPAGCVNLDNDRDNCGVCGNGCGLRERCEFGSCVCEPGTSRCGPGECCLPGEQCCRDADGVGRNCCPPSLTCCGDGICRDLGTQLHCGACFDECTDNERCCQNACTPVDTVSQCGECGRPCGPGEECCRKGTVDLTVGNRFATVENWTCTQLNTNLDCNGCNDSCPAPKLCQNRRCVCPSNREPCGTTCCPVGQDCCNGMCVDTQSSQQHCGACNNPCLPPKICQAGICDCPTNRAPCGTTCCPVGQECSNGLCCSPGLTNCGGQCVDLQSNVNHCGACGRAVTNFRYVQSNGTTVTVNLNCVNGAPQCPTGWLPCAPPAICCPASTPVCNNLGGLLAPGIAVTYVCCPLNAPTAFVGADGFLHCR